MRSIIALAESLGLRIITEGIETKEDAEFFEQFPNVQLQGFYFARPMDVACVEKIIRKQSNQEG